MNLIYHLVNSIAQLFNLFLHCASIGLTNFLIQLQVLHSIDQDVFDRSELCSLGRDLQFEFGYPHGCQRRFDHLTVQIQCARDVNCVRDTLRLDLTGRLNFVVEQSTRRTEKRGEDHLSKLRRGSK